MKRVYSLTILFNLCIGQKYEISIWGFPVANVEQTINESGKIKFYTYSIGVFDLIWPTKNYYEAQHDTNSYILQSWGKKIQQGDFKQKLNAYLDSSGVLVYDKKNKINLPDSTRSILNLLSLIQTIEAERIDTKWLPYEHEGMIGNARFLWADTVNVWNGNDSIFCDYYRLDLEIIDNTTKISAQSDYFMEEIVIEENVREIWVAHQIPKRIIQASLKTAWFQITARIKE